jgi:hypothetical protein
VCVIFANIHYILHYTPTGNYLHVWFNENKIMGLSGVQVGSRMCVHELIHECLCVYVCVCMSFT